MATKLTDQCLRKVADDEPIFVLRAQDLLAPLVVGYWAGLAQAQGVAADKIGEAIELALQMQAWAVQHGSKIPD